MSSTAQRAETRIYKQQYDQIADRYGPWAAIAANYGWGVSGGDDFLSIATKVYVPDGPVVLQSEWTKHQGISHDWQEDDR
jgi:hypothetical protein